MIWEWETILIRQKPSLPDKHSLDEFLQLVSSLFCCNHKTRCSSASVILSFTLGLLKQFLITRLKLWSKAVDFVLSLGWLRFIPLLFRHLIQDSKLCYSQLRKQISRSSMWIYKEQERELDFLNQKKRKVGGSHCWPQLHNGVMQRRQRQTLLRGA